jgi:RNA polymerase sigma-70 factor (ECF subfamily)
MNDRSTRDSLERIFRTEAGRLTASLVKVTRDWDLAEELVQDAMVVALEVWPTAGLPENPAAWLLTTARRRAVDRIRRDAVGQTKLGEVARAIEGIETTVRATDDRLLLLFACCHPALRPESRVALTLRTVAGLQPAEIGRALLTSEATIAKRLTRAKKKIAQAGIPYRMPPAEDVPSRLREVLAVVYLIFNEGYLTSRGTEPGRPDLAEEAAWLATTLAELVPDESEVISLLALIRLHIARWETRFDDDELVLLEDQDRTRWDRGAIDSALHLLDRAARTGHRGPYELQARIAACHAAAPSFELTPWTEIAALYDELYARWPTPVVALNRAVAIGHTRGWPIALAELEPVAADLESYGPFHVARSEMLRRSGRIAEAILSAQRAITLTTNAAERRLLHHRIAELTGNRTVTKEESRGEG